MCGVVLHGAPIQFGTRYLLKFFCNAKNTLILIRERVFRFLDDKNDQKSKEAPAIETTPSPSSNKDQSSPPLELTTRLKLEQLMLKKDIIVQKPDILLTTRKGQLSVLNASGEKGDESMLPFCP